MAAKRVPLLCALAALVLSGTAVVAVISQRSWNVTALIRMLDTEAMAPLAAESDADFSFVHDGHYDGVYFYAIATDPLARGEAHELIDEGSYRYGHPGYGWLAWLFSAGKASLAPEALLVVGLAGVAAAAGFGSLLFQRFGLSPWAGLFIAVNPGLIFSVSTDTSESVGSAFLVIGLLAWTNLRWSVSALTFGFLCFIKEWFLLVPVGLLAWEAVKWRRGNRSSDLPRRTLVLVPGPLLFVLWQVYLTVRFDRAPFRDGADNLAFPPLSGWIDSLERAVELGLPGGEGYQLGYAAVPLLASVLGILLIASIAALRLRTPIDPIFLLIAGVVLSSTYLTILYPKDLLRTMAIPLVLMPAVFAARMTFEKPLRD